jgi:hypothetical protein
MPNKSIIAAVLFVFAAGVFYYFSKDQIDMVSKKSGECEIDARVSIVGNEFPAIQTVGAGAKECKGAEVTANLTADHQKN